MDYISAPILGWLRSVHWHADEEVDRVTDRRAALPDQSRTDVREVDMAGVQEVLGKACQRPGGWRRRDRADRQMPLLVLRVDHDLDRSDASRQILELCQEAEPCPIPCARVTLPDSAAQPADRPGLWAALDKIVVQFKDLELPSFAPFRYLRFPRYHLVSNILDFKSRPAEDPSSRQNRPRTHTHTERSELRAWLADRDRIVRALRLVDQQANKPAEALGLPWSVLRALLTPIAAILFSWRLRSGRRWIGGPYLWLRTNRSTNVGAAVDTSFFTVCMNLMKQSEALPADRFRDYADRLLFHCFLADLQSAYERGKSLWRGWAKTVYPVLIVDNVTEDNRGLALLRKINEVRSGGQWDPLMVIALADDRSQAQLLANRSASVSTSAQPRTRRARGPVALYDEWAARFPGTIPPPVDWLLFMSMVPEGPAGGGSARIRTRRRPYWTRLRAQAVATIALLATGGSIWYANYQQRWPSRARLASSGTPLTSSMRPTRTMSASGSPTPTVRSIFETTTPLVSILGCSKITSGMRTAGRPTAGQS